MRSVPRIPCLLLALGTSLLSPPVFADWEYTRWGMTQTQVIEASRGAAKTMAPADRYRNDADHYEITTEGTYKDGLLVLTVGFMFDTQGGGLKCVLYNAAGPQIELLRAMLGRRYGKPLKESEFGGAQTQTWKSPDEIELVAMKNPLTAALTHCAPGKG